MKENIDDNWYVTVYKNDIYDRLKVLESERLPYANHSPQLKYRRELVKWLKEIYDRIQFCRVTFHLAVFLLDFFMDSYSIRPEGLYIVAFVCLTLAGKFEEQEAYVPKISEMNEELQSNYTKKEILYYEKTILNHFKWKLTVPTSVHFADYYLNFAVMSQSICKDCCNHRYFYVRCLRCAVYEYLDGTVEDNLLVSYSPSFVASSCILAVRMEFQLEPVWSKQLEEITTYTYSELKKCSVRILEFRKKNQKLRKRRLQQSPDLGYETEKGHTLTPKAKKDQVS